MRRSKRCVTSKYKKNTAEKQKITKTDNVVPDEEQKQSTKESIENTDQIEKQDTLTKQELAASSSDDVTSKQGSAAGGRTEEGSMIEAKTEPRREMPDFFFQDEDGDTYLHIAVVQCNEGLVNYLIQAMKTTKLDIFNNLRQTPLHLSVITGQRNLIGLLIKAGCDVNAMDRNGQTPLHLACQRNDVESARVIFDHVSTHGNIDIKMNVNNFDGVSPLHLAAMAGNRDLIGLLIDKGADINTKDTSSGRTALHHAVEAGKYHVVEFLLSRGASANVMTCSGNSPLHTAAGRHMLEMIRLLCDHGADVNLANMEGDKPRVVHTSQQGQRQLEASRKRSKKTTNDKSSKLTGETSTKKTKS